MRFSVGVHHPRQNNLPSHTKTGFVCPHLDSFFIREILRSLALLSSVDLPEREASVFVTLATDQMLIFPIHSHEFSILSQPGLPLRSLAVSVSLCLFYCLALFLCQGMCERFCVCWWLWHTSLSHAQRSVSSWLRRLDVCIRTRVCAYKAELTHKNMWYLIYNNPSYEITFCLLL